MNRFPDFPDPGCIGENFHARFHRKIAGGNQSALFVLQNFHHAKPAAPVRFYGLMKAEGGDDYPGLLGRLDDRCPLLDLNHSVVNYYGYFHCFILAWKKLHGDNRVLLAGAEADAALDAFFCVYVMRFFLNS